MSPTPKGSAVSPQHVGTPAESTPPEIGTLVYDEASGRTGDEKSAEPPTSTA